MDLGDLDGQPTLLGILGWTTFTPAPPGWNLHCLGYMDGNFAAWITWTDALHLLTEVILVDCLLLAGRTPLPMS
eukprot:4841262-Karenia_brevis.AAC.1